MKKTAIKLAILSIVLLVSISGIALGAVNTDIPNQNSTDVVNDTAINDTANVTEEQTVSGVTSDTENATEQNVTSIEATVDATPESIADTIPAPQETSVPQPVQTPKSPGFESVGSAALLLLAMYVNKRR